MVGDYVAGSVALAVTLGAWIPAADRIQRRIAPTWRGAEALLARLIIGVTGVLLVAQLLGLVDGFGRWRMAAASAAVTALVAVLVRPVSRAPHRSDRLLWASLLARYDVVELAGMAVAVLAVGAVILGRGIASLHTGPLDGDALHYHLPQAAQFVQQHSTLHLHYTGPSDTTAFYPFNGELLDAVLMLGPHPDLGIFVLNPIFAAIFLLACWVIGERFASPPLAVTAGALILALPVAARLSSGPGMNDLPGLAMFASGVAMLAVAGVGDRDALATEWRAALAVAGLALGVTAGIKLSFLAPAVLVSVGAVAIATTVRRQTLALVGIAATVPAAFWYIRNWVQVGTPFPAISLTVGGHGLHAVPTPEVTPYAFSVAHYFNDASVIHHWFLPGVAAALSDAWPVTVLLLAIGVIEATRRGASPLRRMLAVVTVMSVGVYLVTPTTAIGPPGAPTLFAANVRYALPAFALAAFVVGTMRLSARYARVLAVVLAVLTVVTLSTSRVFTDPVAMTAGLAAMAAIALAAGFVVVGRPIVAGRYQPAALISLSVLGFAVAGGVIQHSYLKDRYAATDARSALFAVIARDPTPQRVGDIGLTHQYPEYGPDLRNTVRYVGVTAPDGSFDGPRSCPALLRVLTEQRDQLFVVEPLALEHTADVQSWIQAVPGVTVRFSNRGGTIYVLPASLPSASCPT